MKAHLAFNHYLLPGGGESKLCEVECARGQEGRFELCHAVKRDEV